MVIFRGSLTPAQTQSYQRLSAFDFWTIFQKVSPFFEKLLKKMTICIKTQFCGIIWLGSEVSDNMNDYSFGQLIFDDGIWTQQIVGSVEWIVMEETNSKEAYTYPTGKSNKQSHNNWIKKIKPLSFE